VFGIGQGPILATPLQLAMATAAIANRGERMAPRLVRATVYPRTGELNDVKPQAHASIPLNDKGHLETLIQHMVDTVHTPKGTAYRIGWNAPYKIAGKTGTSQVIRIPQGQVYDEKQMPERLRDHALFIAFAPAEEPQVAVAVIVENGGSGSAAAAPIARKVMDYVVLGKVTLPSAGPAPKLENEE
jgi:penicillin-binding protein 2